MGKLKDIRVKKIGVFRALQLGDLICSVPGIKALKKLFPDSAISLISLPWAEEFVNRYPNYFSDFIHFPGYPGLPEQQWSNAEFVKFLKEINNERFDLIIQMHGNGSIINPMIQLLGAKYTAGFYQPDSYCPDRKLFMSYPEGIPEVNRHLKLAKFLGASDLQTDLEFPVSLKEVFRYQNLCRQYELMEKEYVCVHTGARDERKWWSAKNFSEVADHMVAKGYKVVLTGTEIERKMVKEVARLMKFSAVNLTGKTDLGTLAELIKNSRMLFSNDTGVSHLAAAVKTPSVIIFLFSDPVRWAPLNKKLHEIILPEYAEDLRKIKSKIDRVLEREERSFDAPELRNIKLKIGS